MPVWKRWFRIVHRFFKVNNGVTYGVSKNRFHDRHRDVIVNTKIDTYDTIFEQIYSLRVRPTLEYKHPVGIMKGYVKFTFSTKWSRSAGQCARNDLKKYL